MKPASRTFIGRFRVERVLGSGGMGEVYQAFDPTLQRSVAVKTVRPDIDRPDFFERLYREAQACARLQHPNIVTIYEAGDIDGEVYIAMEYLEGENLASALRRDALTFADKLRILIQILEALEHAHAGDVIHRDIKPSNVHLRADGSVKLVDFGIARITSAAPLTQTGAVMGTPYYASPEQLKGGPVDKRTDIYSTGALAYEMFTGRRPFEGVDEGVGSVILKVVTERPAPMTDRWTQAFPEIERIIRRAMAKSPEARYQTAAEMRSALVALVEAAGDAIQSPATAPMDSGARSTSDDATIPLTRPRAVPEFESSDGDSAIKGAAPAAIAVVESVAGQPATRVLSVPNAERRSTARSSRAAWWMAGAAAAIVAAATLIITRPSEPQRASAAPDVQTARPPAPAVPSAPDAQASDAGAEVTVQPSASESTTTPPVVTPPTSTPDRVNPTAGAARDGAPTAGPGAAAAEKPILPGATPITGPASAPVTEPGINETSAKQLFTPGANAGLKYRLIQRRGNIETDVDPSTPFQSGDRLRFVFESNIDGYLYVVQQGSTGRWTVLFPDPEINGGRNAIKRFEQYNVPSEDWFEFDTNPGTEHIFVFLSREPLTQLPGFNAPVTRTESVSGSVIGQLQSSINPRDLVLQKDRGERASATGQVTQSTYVVNRDEIGQAVAAFIALIHGR